MAEIDPLKQMTDFSVSKGSNFKFPVSQKTGSSRSVSPFSSDSDSSGILNNGYTEYDTTDGTVLDEAVDGGTDGDLGGGGNAGGGGGSGIIKLPSNFTVTFTSEIVEDPTGNQTATLFATCSAVPGATNFEIKLVKIA